MTDLAMSRRNVATALLTLPAIAAPALAVASANIEQTASPEWSNLLERERSAFAAWESACETYDEVEIRFNEQRSQLPDLLDRTFPEIVGTDQEAADAYNRRVSAAVQEWNRSNGQLKSEMKNAVMRLRASSGLDAAASARFDASMAHDEAMMALLAHPSTNSTVVAEKLQLVLDRGYQDCLDEVVASINGGRA